MFSDWLCTASLHARAFAVEKCSESSTDNQSLTYIHANQDCVKLHEFHLSVYHLYRTLGTAHSPRSGFMLDTDDGQWIHISDPSPSGTENQRLPRRFSWWAEVHPQMQCRSCPSLTLGSSTSSSVHSGWLAAGGQRGRRRARHSEW